MKFSIFSKPGEDIFRAAVQVFSFLIINLSAFLKKHWQKISAGIILFTAGSSVLTAGGVYIKFKLDENKIRSTLNVYKSWMSGKERFQEKAPVQIFSSEGSLIGILPVENASRLTFDRCESMTWLKKASVSAEDRDFYSHGGVSYRGIMRAAFRNIISLKLAQGAGSITQQLARNLFTSRSWPLVPRKLYETYAAFLIEDLYSKDEILCLYLNRIYMGEGMYGAEEAANFYFRKKPEKLSPSESAMIAGLFPSPVRYSPLNNIRRALKKQSAVLDLMVEDKHLTEKQRNHSMNAFMNEYKIVTDEEDPSPGTVGLYGINRYFKLNHAPDVNEYVRRYLLERFSNDEMISGLRVYTTVQKKKQLASIHAIRSAVETVRNKMKKKSAFSPSETEKLLAGYNGVFVSIHPRTGEILALVGGFQIAEDEYTDRAWKMLRQPGSSLKGFLYALALEEGIYSLDSLVTDEKINISGYKPRNWYKGYKGEMSLSKAVAMSVNTVAVKTLNELGSGYYKKILSRAGDIPSDRFDSNLSLALGSGELTVIELASIYSVLLNAGRKTEPHLIKKIVSERGEVFEEYAAYSQGRKILEPETAKDAVSLLQNVVNDPEGTANWVSSSMKKSRMSFPVAAKTGTVQTVGSVRKKYRNMPGIHDVWFVALVPGEVNVVWIGHDDGAPFEGSGSSTAAAAWFSYASGGLRDLKQNSFDFSDELPANLTIFEEENNENIIYTDPEIHQDKKDEPNLKDYYKNTDSDMENLYQKDSEEYHVPDTDEQPVG